MKMGGNVQRGLELQAAPCHEMPIVLVSVFDAESKDG